MNKGEKKKRKRLPAIEMGSRNILGGKGNLINDIELGLLREEIIRNFQR